jgi:hypothetical protein
MILIETKYLMKLQNDLARGRKAVQDRLGSEAVLPTYFFNVPLDERNDADMQRLFQGLPFPSTKPPVSAPATPPAIPPRFKVQ